MEDIAPGLLEAIQKQFKDRQAASPKIRALLARIESGAATYEDAQEYAEAIAEILSDIFGKVITPDVLPNGKMYYNIAQRVISPMLEENHRIVSAAAVKVEQTLNRRAGIGLQAKAAALNKDRIDGIVNRLAEAEKFEDVQWMLKAPIENYSRSVVVDTVKVNADFHSSVGMQPVIERTGSYKCCEWCASLIRGSPYQYPNVPDDVWRVHERCKCTVTYNPGSGKRQNVHTKKWN